MTPYQEGYIELRKRKRLPNLYELHYRKYAVDGTSTHERVALGTVKELPTKKALMEKAAEVREQINSEPKGIFFRDVARRYRKEHIEANLRPKSQGTATANLHYLEEAFNDRRIVEITPGDVDMLVNSLRSRVDPSRELSRTTRKHVKALAHHLWRHAMLWGYLNPQVNIVSIARVTTGARPQSRSKVSITHELFEQLLGDPKLASSVKVIITVAYYTGMGVSEILGLKWQDVDFRNLVIHVRRSSVGKHIDETKNAFREDDIPLHRDVAQALRKWKASEPAWGDGWIFGSPFTERPYHQTGLQRLHLGPAGERAGVGRLGWHSFRHAFSADSEIAGVSLRIRQKLMRHGDPNMTQQYGKNSPALFEEMRAGQNRVALQRKRTGTRG